MSLEVFPLIFLQEFEEAWNQLYKCLAELGHMVLGFCWEVVFFNYLLIFRERGRGRREREASMCEEKHWFAASCMPPTGTWPTAQACALTGSQNQQSFGPLSPLSHTSQGERLLNPDPISLLVITQFRFFYYSPFCGVRSKVSTFWFLSPLSKDLSILSFQKPSSWSHWSFLLFF